MVFATFAGAFATQGATSVRGVSGSARSSRRIAAAAGLFWSAALAYRSTSARVLWPAMAAIVWVHPTSANVVRPSCPGDAHALIGKAGLIDGAGKPLA
jgi:hypothetical protein